MSLGAVLVVDVGEQLPVFAVNGVVLEAPAEPQDQGLQLLDAAGAALDLVAQVGQLVNGLLQGLRGLVALTGQGAAGSLMWRMCQWLGRGGGTALT